MVIMIPANMQTWLQKVLGQKTFAEFFAGIGLMRMGLEQAGWAPAFANDIDRDKEEMYRAIPGNQRFFPAW